MEKVRKSERRQVLATETEWKRFDKWASENGFSKQSEAIRAAIIMIGSYDKTIKGKPLKDVKGNIDYTSNYKAIIKLIIESINENSNIFIDMEDLSYAIEGYDYSLSPYREGFYKIQEIVNKIKEDTGCMFIRHGVELVPFGGEMHTSHKKGYIFFNRKEY